MRLVQGDLMNKFYKFEQNYPGADKVLISHEPIPSALKNGLENNGIEVIAGV